MANYDGLLINLTPRLLSVLRIITAYLFMAHGAQKLFGWFAPPPAPGATPPAFELLSQTGVAGVLEFFGGLLFLLGLFTRPVAFILSGLMAFAYFLVHAKMGPWLLPGVNKGELAVLYCFVFLFFAAAGGGEWSLDRLLRRDVPTFRSDVRSSAREAV